MVVAAPNVVIGGVEIVLRIVQNVTIHCVVKDAYCRVRVAPVLFVHHV